MNEKKPPVNILINVYLVLIAWMVPLYLASGYLDAGERKSLLFISGSTVLTLLSLILSGAGLITGMKGVFARIKQGRSGSGDHLILLLLLSAAVQTISFLLSEHKDTALLGTVGWRMGYIPQMVFLVFAVLIAQFYEISHVTWYILFGGELPVLLLGIMTRLKIYPVPGTDIGMHYISTTGNIDWTLTYLSVLYPLVLGLLLLKQKDGTQSRARLQLLLGINAMLTQLMIVMLGAGSSFLVLILPALLLIIPAIQTGNHRRLLCLIASTGCMAETAWLIRIIDGGKKWNDVFSPGNPLTGFVKHHGGAALAVVSVLALLLLKNRDSATKSSGSSSNDSSSSAERRNKDRTSRSDRRCRSEHLIRMALFCLPVLLLFMQLFASGLLSDSFGNGRGYIWRISADAIRTLTPGRKLFGTGQDTLGVIIAEIYDSAELAAHYGEATLRNAHSLLLNKMLETGIVGSASFIALVAAALCCLKRRSDAEDTSCTAAAGGAILCYYLLGSIMFEQVIATPLFYAVIGLAGALSGSGGDNINSEVQVSDAEEMVSP